jgi:hypothetical protein
MPVGFLTDGQRRRFLQPSKLPRFGVVRQDDFLRLRGFLQSLEILYELALGSQQTQEERANASR